jgi:DNA-binding Lrp family transcriptional regulator/sugar lactone lactonase YvrE
LSSSPCWRRIKRLEDAGVIQRRVTILDRDKLGLGFEVYCTVKLSLPTKDNLDSFETAIGKLAEVVQCATVTGAADYELRIVTRDMHAFDDFLRDKILGLGLVSNIESRIVIRSVKNTTAAPLGLVSPMSARRASAAVVAISILAGSGAAAPRPATAPAGKAPTLTTLAEDERRDLVIEGIAGYNGRWFVSAVAARTIFQLQRGKLTAFLRRTPNTGAILGMSVDAPRGVLWAAEAWGAHLPGNSGARRTGLLKVSLADGRVLGRYPAPDARTFGDVVVDPAGAVYASDSGTGAVWVLPPGENALRLVGKPKGATSAQGMVLCPLDVMVVSDYPTGLHRLDLADGSSRRLTSARGTVKVAGLDSLVLLSDRNGLDVAATYNGDQPYRLLRLRISADCKRLETVDTLIKGDAVHDIALAARAPGGLAVITNSQWAGWTDGRRNDVDPGAARVSLVKLPPVSR